MCEDRRLWKEAGVRDVKAMDRAILTGIQKERGGHGKSAAPMRSQRVAIGVRVVGLGK